MQPPARTPERLEDLRSTVPVRPMATLPAHAMAGTPAGARSAMPTAAPSTTSIPPQASGRPKRLLAIVAAALVALIGGAAFGARAWLSESPEDALVRVAAGGDRGAGFFVRGPAGEILVVTSFALVSKGGAITVLRGGGDDGTETTTALSGARLVAYDARADLAVLSLPDSGERLVALELAEDALANEKVRALGYDQLGGLARPISREGSLENRVELGGAGSELSALRASFPLGRGFEGGPTINSDGAVVGVNLSDEMAESGIVHVKHLEPLLERDHELGEPSRSDVGDFIEQLEKEYLSRPLAERQKLPVHQFVSVADRAALAQLVDEIRRYDRDTLAAAGTKNEGLTGQAIVGLWAARMPGLLPLETYRASPVQDALVACERQQARWVRATSDEPGRGLGECDEAALRPLAWDLTAATLGWTGETRRVKVEKISLGDGDRFRARVSLGDGESITLWFSMAGGELRLSLFDDAGALYAADNLAIDDEAIRGRWRRESPRSKAEGMPFADHRRRESLHITPSDGGLSIQHVVDETLEATDGSLFRCSRAQTIETGLEQRFTGRVQGGVVTAERTGDTARVGQHGEDCQWGYQKDAAAVFKLEGDKLLMIRSDGSAYPTSATFERVEATP